ncbi:cytochrome c biogenesis CcdA family protein [Mesorhizobium sp. M2A.F.Ca.ET.067.02.1.1]|uniref:cytochrome c biogenesis CcdA family protein n=1 Tax=Mesorhizobium sp. M2A.F.Ca.ET.067.02.1.1 TaxID=2496749 RepID=UPI000FD2A58D|nr:cytochrome c biogenesis CcdA family protein [Mesorhizobium sp. M2A.F.Ca.ET.067.02.1.1]RUW80176.1 cytochrome c biogenesis protein CcdA [Mesorhizobium sp. M2A.F.Ca.ET.067.02.1.1]TIU58583.1 MAG: cytochrome c biogenesis protein CcdA [Mesorhizobium sp.]
MLLGFGFSFLAGLLSTLSPCVLPLIPVVLGAAVAQHRYGPAALAAGLAISFTAIGLFVATIGFSIGLDNAVFRSAASVLMLVLGAVLVLPALQTRVALAAGPAGNWVDQRFGRFSSIGLWGQFGVGLLLGTVWSPCVGPTLGAASVLAAQGRNLGQVAATMVLFGIGAAVPLLIFGMLSRETLLRWRGRIAEAGGGFKIALGGVLILTGVAILSGFDKRLETVLVDISPEWLTVLTTQF